MVEKLLRVVHTGAYLTGWLTREGPKIFWMTDDDAIVSNADRALQTVKLFQSVLPIYSRHNYGQIGYAMPSLMDNVGRLSDFLSVTDLAAGAVERFLTKRDTNGLHTLRPEAETILHWLGRQGMGLKKHTMLIRLADSKHLESAELRFGNSEPPFDAITVPVAVKRI